MFKLAPGGIFRREARWMLVLLLLPLAAFLLTIVIPWVARSFSHP